MSSNKRSHLPGQGVDTVDQLSSVILLGIAVIGALGVVVVDLLVIG